METHGDLSNTKLTDQTPLQEQAARFLNKNEDLYIRAV
jgi:hypothetical protein